MSLVGGLPIIQNTGGLKATDFNFITMYDYYMQFMPHLVHELYYANGKGNITGLLKSIGQEDTYASDVVKHSEMGRLHNRLTDVSVDGNDFTSQTPHNLQVGMEILISDATIERQGTVSAIISDTVFTALNKEVGAWGFTDDVDISTDFSNSWGKGTENFEDGYKWDPNIYENYTHILKWVYKVPNSDRSHIVWLDCPDGTPRWCNVELERSNVLFDNLVEITHFFRSRTESGSDAHLAGFPQGMKSIAQQGFERGNSFNGYITSIKDLENIALRAEENGGDVSEYYVMCDMTQMNYFNAMAAQVSSGLVGGNGTNYGAFNNSKDMALALDFRSIYVSGITFHFKPWKILNDPTLLAAGRFDTTGFAFMIIPAGRKNVIVDGREQSKPYLSVLYRSLGDENRRREVQVFGRGGTPHKKDTTEHHFLSETTNQVVGANMWFFGYRA